MKERDWMIMRMYCDMEMKAVRTLIDAGILFDEEEVDYMYHKVLKLARERAKDWRSYDEIYRDNYENAAYARRHGAYRLADLLEYGDCIEVVRPRPRRVKKAV